MNLTSLFDNGDVRAAGLWKVRAASLEQVEFVAAPDMAREVVEDFARATRSVGLSQTTLGIVGAVLDSIPRISVASELVPDSGSGFWLRRFGADRSIAVPLVRKGLTIAVLSVAVRGVENDASRWITDLQQIAASLLI